MVTVTSVLFQYPPHDPLSKILSRIWLKVLGLLSSMFEVCNLITCIERSGPGISHASALPSLKKVLLERLLRNCLTPVHISFCFVCVFLAIKLEILTKIVSLVNILAYSSFEVCNLITCVEHFGSRYTSRFRISLVRGNFVRTIADKLSYR